MTFAPDAGEVVRHIYARKPRQLENCLTEREQLLNGAAPVRWWYATVMLDREGIQVEQHFLALDWNRLLRRRRGRE